MIAGGLFGNPMFAGSRNTAASYGRMYSNLDEIAGHHIVYAITNKSELVVRAVPLRHPAQVNSPIAVFAESAFVDAGTSTTTINWLLNLPFGVANDMPVLKKMIHDPSTGHKHWTCPIRQMLLWSAQMPSFLPVTPNPMRSGRLYRKILVSYTPSGQLQAHPTTNATNIDRMTRLHTNYWTTNGFCVYKGGGAVVSSEACSLYSLARATFSNEWNNFTTVFGGSVCTEQVNICLLCPLFFDCLMDVSSQPRRSTGPTLHSMGGMGPSSTGATFPKDVQSWIGSHTFSIGSRQTPLSRNQGSRPPNPPGYVTWGGLPADPHEMGVGWSRAWMMWW